MGNLRLLPSLDVVAVSQAPSPESNPDSPLPVVTMVSPTVRRWGAKRGTTAALESYTRVSLREEVRARPLCLAGAAAHRATCGSLSLHCQGRMLIFDFGGVDFEIATAPQNGFPYRTDLQGRGRIWNLPGDEAPSPACCGDSDTLDVWPEPLFDLVVFRPKFLCRWSPRDRREEERPSAWCHPRRQGEGTWAKRPSAPPLELRFLSGQNLSPQN
ncbi:hypothetical protein G5714_005198 [Onychostoma macrolepis]|uniref:Uncharacterized protein n=1 Tax=Onychostoma macrolepis TaxID=369639 RepID=A0A7J6D7F7_9TELE|nr:hypothetical protein G5714_005198 [Onychostoma macrolepis]